MDIYTLPCETSVMCSFEYSHRYTPTGVPPPVLTPCIYTDDPSNLSLDLLLNSPETLPPPSRLRLIMYRLANLLALLTFVTILVLIPVLTVQGFRDKNTQNDHIAFYSSAAFVGLTVPLSMYTIYQHLANYYRPKVQQYVVRILWMVPLYSVQSWLSLRFHESSVWIER